VTVTVAVEPGTTAHSPPLPDGDGIVNVIAVLLQLSRLNVARSGGAPQLVPSSLKVM
jgi:hypothetical protein